MTTPDEPFDNEAEEDDEYDRAFDEMAEDGTPRDGAEAD
jgi:hypothetical protein